MACNSQFSSVWARLTRQYCVARRRHSYCYDSFSRLALTRHPSPRPLLNWLLQATSMAGMKPGFLSFVFCVLLSSATSLAAETRLALLTFNAEGAGLNTGKPIDETVAVLRAADADIIGLQEAG